MKEKLIAEYKQFTKDKEFKKEDIPALIWNLFHSEHIHEITFSDFKQLFYELVNG